MATVSEPELAEKFLAAFKEPRLILELDTCWSLNEGVLSTITFKAPPEPPARKPVDLVGMPWVGNKDESHASMLRRLADMIERAPEKLPLVPRVPDGRGGMVAAPAHDQAYADWP